MLTTPDIFSPPLNFPAAPTAAVAAGTGVFSLTYESDLMQNYLQGQVVSPQGKFEALQTSDGYGLLFALDTSSVLHVIHETSGATVTGWETFDLSTAAIQGQFAGQNDVTVRTFDAVQSALDQSISLAMAVSAGGSDHLLTSLGNSSSYTSWVANKPAWTSYPFDAVGQSPSTSIKIAGILFAETKTTTPSAGQQYLIVDIDRSAQGQTKDIARYYVDPSKATGSYWVKHDVPVDIEDGSYQSCVGRMAQNTTDGVYTSGTVAGAAQLFYMPILNEFGAGPPPPTLLALPGGASPTAMATARNFDQTTDLYAISGSTLYRFAADTQGSRKPGMALVTSGFLSGTDKLMAMTQKDITTLWGKNGDDQIYYLSCPDAQVSLPGVAFL